MTKCVLFFVGCVISSSIAIPLSLDSQSNSESYPTASAVGVHEIFNLAAASSQDHPAFPGLASPHILQAAQVQQQAHQAAAQQQAQQLAQRQARQAAQQQQQADTQITEAEWCQDIDCDTSVAKKICPNTCQTGECPKESPTWPYEPCIGNLTCNYGEECCCGKCHPSYVATCSEGQWWVMVTDACMSRCAAEEAAQVAQQAAQVALQRQQRQAAQQQEAAQHQLSQHAAQQAVSHQRQQQQHHNNVSQASQQQQQYVSQQQTQQQQVQQVAQQLQQQSQHQEPPKMQPQRHTGPVLLLQQRMESNPQVKG